MAYAVVCARSCQGVNALEDCDSDCGAILPESREHLSNLVLASSLLAGMGAISIELVIAVKADNSLNFAEVSA